MGTHLPLVPHEHHLGDAEGRPRVQLSPLTGWLRTGVPDSNSLTMHINLGLAFHTHRCSMFHRLRKQFLSGHEWTPRDSVYSKCLSQLQRDEGFPGTGYLTL